jgi:hypothetical protein
MEPSGHRMLKISNPTSLGTQHGINCWPARRSFGDWWHHLESTWIVRCTRSPGEIRHELKSYIGNNDQLLVIEISGDTAEWTGVNDAGSRWLKDNI